jgi:hypothetical protein
MPLVGEMQESRWHTKALKDIESLKALRLHNAIIQIIMDNELRRARVGEVSERIPKFIVLAFIPHCAVVVVLDEPDLVGSVGSDLVHFAVVADERLELAAKVVALNPAWS